MKSYKSIPLAAFGILWLAGYMGIISNTEAFLRHESKSHSFGDTLVIGRQRVYMPRGEYEASLGRASSEWPHADELFRALGAREMSFLDASGYEGARVIHDLNEPLPNHLAGSFDTVIECGSLEHVFNFPVALRSCMEMLRVNGRLLMSTVWNGWGGHGFYQFSPELFFRALSPTNGFSSCCIYIADGGEWYEISDPAAVGERVELRGELQALIYVSATKSAFMPFTYPQQSDYEAAWAADAPQQSPGMKDRIVGALPPLGALQSAWRERKARVAASTSNRKHFTPIQI